MPLLRRWAKTLLSLIRPVRRNRSLSVPGLTTLETRDVPSGPDSAIPAFDVIALTAMRQDPTLAVVDGRLPNQARNIGIAIIDTGLYGAHSAIRGNFKAFLNVNSGFTTTNPDEATAAEDPTGHGTHVASTAASTNPNIGVATGADLIGLGISGGDVLTNAESALKWVLAHAQEYNIKVVNLSVRTGGDSIVNINSLTGAPDPAGLSGLIGQAESQGIAVVAASGNSYAAFAAPGVEVPAAYASLNVAATWEDNGAGDRFPYPAGTKGDLVAFDRSASTDRLASFSQRSTLPNQVAAPGATILGASVRGPDEYVDSAGTSMAAPMVSGLVALMQDAAMTFGSRYLPVSDVVRIIRQTSDLIVDSPHDQNGYFDPSTGGFLPLPETGITIPRINVLKAVQQVRSEVMASKTAVDLNATITNANKLPPLNTTQPQYTFGNVGRDGESLVGADDVDVYQVVISSPGQLSVSAILPANGSGLRLRLLNPDGLDLPLTPSSNGATIAITADYLTPGTYFIGVSGGANTSYNIITGSNHSNGVAVGDYKLTIALQTLDPDGTIGTAPDVLIGSRLGLDPRTNIGGLIQRGILGQNMLQDGAWQPVGSADVNFSRWTAPDSGYVTLHVHSTQGLHFQPPQNSVSFDTFLRVFLPDGTPYIDKFGTAGLSGDIDGSTDSSLTMWVDRGQVYYIGVSASGTASGTSTPNRYDPLTVVGRNNPLPAFRGYYELFVGLNNNDLDGTPITANVITAGNKVEGSLGRTPDLDFIGLDGTRDVNYYRLTMPSTGLLDVSLTGFSGFRTAAELWLANDAGIPTQRLQSGTGSILRWLLPVEGGQNLMFSVTGAGNVGVNWSVPGSGTGGGLGAFTLSTLLRPISELAQLGAGSANTATPIQLNQVVQGDLSGDPIGSTGYLLGNSIDANTGKISYLPADLDVFRFVAEFNGQVSVNVSTLPEIGFLSDPVLVIFDGNGQAIQQTAISSATGGKITLRTTAFRTYYFGITGRSSQSTAYDVLNGQGLATRTATTGGPYLLWVTDPVIDSLPPPPPNNPPPPPPPNNPPTVPPPPLIPKIPDAPVIDPTVPPVVVVPPALPPTVPPAVVSVEPVSTSPPTTGTPIGTGVPVAMRHFTVSTSLGQVLLMDTARNTLQTVTPGPGFTGELRTTTADYNGDGVPDIVVGTGLGPVNQVAVYDGVTGQLIHRLQPFESSFTGGVFVTTGDVTGDGRADLIITPDTGGGPRVRILDGANGFNVVADFLGIEDPNFRGGARATVGDLNRDGVGDLIVAAGFGGGPRVAIYSGSTVRIGQPTRLVGDFMVFEPTVRNGVFLSTGDITGDGLPDLVVGGGPSSGPRVTVFSGQSLLQSDFSRVLDFFAGPVESRGGVRLAIKDLDGDPQADIITSLGDDPSGEVYGYLGRNLTNGITVTKIMATVPSIDGVYVG